jgi:hypothetical protein
MCIAVTDFSIDSLVTVVVLITKIASDVWYQVHQFSVVIVIISGTKIIHFYGTYGYLWCHGYKFSMVIMVISGTKVISFLWWLWLSLVPRLSLFYDNYDYLWYQGYQFSMIIMIISGTKFISFLW